MLLRVTRSEDRVRIWDFNTYPKQGYLDICQILKKNHMIDHIESDKINVLEDNERD